MGAAGSDAATQAATLAAEKFLTKAPAWLTTTTLLPHRARRRLPLAEKVWRLWGRQGGGWQGGIQVPAGPGVERTEVPGVGESKNKNKNPTRDTQNHSTAWEGGRESNQGSREPFRVCVFEELSREKGWAKNRTERDDVVNGAKQQIDPRRWHLEAYFVVTV